MRWVDKWHWNEYAGSRQVMVLVVMAVAIACIEIHAVDVL
jgi:hypothetical protein